MAIYPVDSDNFAGGQSVLQVVNGRPAIAYTSSQDVKYIRADDVGGTSWTNSPTTLYTGTTGVRCWLEVVNGRPAIVYNDFNTGQIFYLRADDVNGDNWTGTPQNITSGFEVRLSVINGFPAISYITTGSFFISYEISDHIDGDTWGNSSTTIDNTVNGLRHDIAIVNGNPAVVYQDTGLGNIYYMRADSVDGSTWGNPRETVVSSIFNDSDYLSLLVVNGNPAIFYRDPSGESSKYIRSDSVDGSTWNNPPVIFAPADGVLKQDYASQIVNGRPAVTYGYITGAGSTNGPRYIRADDINGDSWTGTIHHIDNQAYAYGSTLRVVDGRPAFPSEGTLNFAIAEDINGDEWVPNSSSSSEAFSSESSSSSFPVPFTEKLNQIIAGNNPDNLIPFTYTPEGGFDYEGDDQTIQFQFRTVNNEFFNYDTLLNPTSPTEIEGSSNCYVPEDDDVNIKHDPIFYVDLIVKDSGVKNVSVRSQEEKYQEESVKYSFIIPKFTWNKDLITDAISSNVVYTPLDDSLGSFWAGTSDDKLYKIEYNSNAAASAYSRDEEGTVKNILVNPDGDEIYVTTDEKLKKYTVAHYIDASDQPQLFVTEDISVDNIYKIMSWYDANIWSALPELGTIQELDPDFLTEENEISGFDAPFKIVRSDYHNATFVAGTNVLWKYDGTIEAVYAIEGYEIADFDVSKNGLLCIALNSADDSYLRIVDRNFFRLLINERFTDGQARFCKFCSNNFFYGLSEIDIGGDQFVAQHHAYNTIDGSYNITQSPNVLFTPEVEETPTPATSPVEIEYPNGGENVLIGGELEVLWKSNKSVNDSVKIELYKEDTFLRTITDSTPNTGVFAWTVPATLDIASDYKIRMEWLANEVNDANEDFSDADFNMVDQFPSSSETEIEFFGSIGVDYDAQNNQMVIVLQSGLVGFLDFEDFSFQGWIDSGIVNFTAMVVKNEQIKEIGDVSKVRIFVGSQPYLSDKWDSGVVETSLNSIYYGGGDNLIPGELYYVNIQVYSADSGWSEVQTKKWIMPKQ
jgi:hypothetical protein